MYMKLAESKSCHFFEGEELYIWRLAVSRNGFDKSGDALHCELFGEVIMPVD